MKILGASRYLPAGAHSPASARERAAPDRSVMAIDYALVSIREALAQARCEAAEIELIVSLSLSPSRLADDPDFSYPRLSHPIQRELGMDRAVVFDLMDADWALALDLAQSFSRELGYRRALVTRAECLAETIGANAQALADGSAAIVLGFDDLDAPAFFAHHDIDHAPLAALHALDSATMVATGCHALAQGAFDGERGARVDPQLLRAPLQALRAQLPDARRGATRHWLYESWFGEAGDEEAGAPTAPMFELPARLHALLRERAQTPDAPRAALAAFSLDPFKPRVGCFALEL